MPNQQAIRYFLKAREHYLARCFAEACAEIQNYGQKVRYDLFEKIDERKSLNPQISVVIVSYQSNEALLDCLDSIWAQDAPAFEIILVDNGGNEGIHNQLTNKPLLWVKSPINLLPSEGRNVGSYFAQSELLVFLDDDAIMAPGYLAAACNAMENTDILALRGKILPKTIPPKVQPPKQYDLGDKSLPAELNLEGNSVVRKQQFYAVTGFDPLLFGHEGKELTFRLRQQYPDMQILYWPNLVIQHDYAQSQRLVAKKERQAIAQDYRQYLKELNVKSGVTILVRAGDDLEAANNFLASLVEHNTYKPIEVLLWVEDSKKALEFFLPYMRNFFVRILPPRGSNIRRIAQQARYDHLLVANLPLTLNRDFLPLWVQQQQADINSVLFCSRDSLSTLTEISLDVGLPRLAKLLDKNIAAKPSISSTPVTKINHHDRIPEMQLSDQLQPKTTLNKSLELSSTIIGGMATIPERLPTLHAVLSRLSPQFTELHVYLNGHSEKPVFTDLKNIIFHMDDSHGDLGAKGKFFGLNFIKSDSYYFSLDDDFFYPEDYVNVMVSALNRYKDKVGVCVHGSIFGNPLDWYFERTVVYAAQDGLKHDKFVNLAGTGTFACRLKYFPIRFIDVMPRTMCDLQISIKARMLNIPMVSIKRTKSWLKTIPRDKLLEKRKDYFSKMVEDDEGRTEVTKKIDWDFYSCKDYILDVLKDVSIPIHDQKKLYDLGFDTDFIMAVNKNKLPENWDAERSELFYRRKYQYYARIIKGNQFGSHKKQLFAKPSYNSLEQLKMMVMEYKNKLEDV